MNEQNTIHDVVIAGGVVVGGDGERELDVAVVGERIVGLFERGMAGEASAGAFPSSAFAHTDAWICCTAANSQQGR